MGAKGLTEAPVGWGLYAQPESPELPSKENQASAGSDGGQFSFYTVPVKT